MNKSNARFVFDIDVNITGKVFDNLQQSWSAVQTVADGQWRVSQREWTVSESEWAVSESQWAMSETQRAVSESQRAVRNAQWRWSDQRTGQTEWRRDQRRTQTQWMSDADWMRQAQW